METVHVLLTTISIVMIKLCSAARALANLALLTQNLYLLCMALRALLSPPPDKFFLVRCKL